MERIPGIRRYLRLPRSVRRQVREDVDSELRFHIDMRTEELISSGIAPHYARERAEMEFGDFDFTVDYCRKQSQRRERKARGMDWINNAIQDARFAVRMLTRSKGFTAVVLITIALGIGMNTAIFSVVNAVLLRPFPFEDPDRLITVWESHPSEQIEHMVVSAPNFNDWREQNESFEDLAAFRSTSFFVDLGEGPVSVQGTRVSIGIFEILRATPYMGRTISTEEDIAGAEPVVLISNSFWTVQLGADPGTIGSSLLIDDQPHTVIGIMQPGFNFPPPISLEGPAPESKSDLWIPFPSGIGEASRGGHNLMVIGRLKEEVSLEAAQTEMSGLAGRLEALYPDTNTGWGIILVPLDEQVFGELRTPLVLLLASVGFVLLIACVNVANLLLARGAARQRELATRASLGAGRGRLVRQLFAESVLLALLGGVLGLALAFACVELILQVAPPSIPRLEETSIDLAVAGFTVAISILTGIIFGIAPVLQGRGLNLSEQLREGGSRTATSRRASRFRSFLVVSEIGLSLILLVGAGLMITSFARLRGVDKGFQPENVLTLRLTLPATRYAEESDLIRAYMEIEDRVNTLPGVVSAGFIYDVPLGGDRQGTGVVFEGEPPPQSTADFHLTNFTFVTPGYFRAMGIQLLGGREFTGSDNLETQQVVIVNRAFAEFYIPGEDPLSKRLMDPGGDGVIPIVGIVGNVRHEELSVEATPQVYLPFAQTPWSRSMSLAVRTAGPPGDIFPAVRQRIRSVDPGLPIFQVKNLERIVDESVAEPRFTTLLLGLFAAIAMLLAIIGIYGLIRYTVSQRVQEIGIRTALGADRGEIIRMVVWQGARLALGGVVIGVIAALALSRVIASQLYNVSPTDPLTIATVSAILTGSAVLASYLPAQRAAKVDPVRALREE